MFGKLTQALKDGLKKTKEKLLGGLKAVLPFGRTLDEGLIEAMEEHLLTADLGPKTATRIVDAVRAAYREKRVRTTDECYAFLKEFLRDLLRDDGAKLRRAASGPTVILVAGVNGSGKTTSIAKLARRLQKEGTVLLCAADTFRAAAVEQLQIWGDRHGVPVVAQKSGSDAASVIFDALQSARARGCDVLLADTAGRLHVKSNLMEELRKIVRVMRKLDPSAPHEVLLVLDAGTGQNGLAQARSFREAVGVSGVALTKLDGTAKGGIVFSVARELGLPIRYIGVGETAEDLREFDARDFVEALFDDAAA